MRDDHAVAKPFQVFFVMCSLVGGAVAAIVWVLIFCNLLMYGGRADLDSAGLDFWKMGFASFLGLALIGFAVAALPLAVQITLHRGSAKYPLSFFVAFCIVGGYLVYLAWFVVRPGFWLL